MYPMMVMMPNASTPRSSRMKAPLSMQFSVAVEFAVVEVPPRQVSSWASVSRRARSTTTSKRRLMTPRRDRVAGVRNSGSRRDRNARWNRARPTATKAAETTESAAVSVSAVLEIDTPVVDVAGTRLAPKTTGPMKPIAKPIIRTRPARKVSWRAGPSPGALRPVAPGCQAGGGAAGHPYPGVGYPPAGGTGVGAPEGIAYGEAGGGGSPTGARLRPHREQYVAPGVAGIPQ